MHRPFLPSIMVPLLCLAAPVDARPPVETDSQYLQNRAAQLNKRIDAAARHRSISRKQAAKLHMSVDQVQTLAGNLQARNGTIERPDADRMNQQLTDVERTLTNQP